MHNSYLVLDYHNTRIELLAHIVLQDYALANRYKFIKNSQHLLRFIAKTT